MSLKKYDFTTPDGYKTTLLLSDEDAKAQGLLKEAASGQKAAPKPANKARKAANKSKS